MGPPACFKYFQLMMTGAPGHDQQLLIITGSMGDYLTDTSGTSFIALPYGIKQLHSKEFGSMLLGLRSGFTCTRYKERCAALLKS